MVGFFQRFLSHSVYPGMQRSLASGNDPLLLQLLEYDGLTDRRAWMV